MISRCLRIACRPSLRRIHQVPFSEDLTEVDEDLFNLAEFKNYRESPEVQAHRRKLGLEEDQTEEHKNKHGKEKPLANDSHVDFSATSFASACEVAKPVVFVSRFSNPYLNLALEDYVYNKMPLPQCGNANRLMFYVNSPCVVIGKNQNPWNEVNVPLLNSLKIPLVRRRSGGGTVVHDTGNVNYSFMTTKDKFDRHTFANLVASAVNLIMVANGIKVTERGDIVTMQDSLKVSGSAYKLSRGKSYHHGTMLLSLNLQVLRQLLHREPDKVGHVQSQAAIASVRLKVANLGIGNEEFIEAVTAGFKETHGEVADCAKNDNVGVNETNDKVKNRGEESEFDLDQTELLGLDDFVLAYSGRECLVFEITDVTEIPEEVEKVKNELMEWEWKFGATLKFIHTFQNPEQDFKVIFSVGKKAILESFELVGAPEEIKEHFSFLQLVLERGDEVKYKGSDIAGFITDDNISDWIGESIDGTT